MRSPINDGAAAGRERTIPGSLVCDERIEGHSDPPRTKTLKAQPDACVSDRTQPPERPPLRTGPADTASLISCQCAYCCFLAGFGSSYSCSQKRNQSTLRSYTASLCLGWNLIWASSGNT